MNATDERAAFLHAIRANPDDDTPRLVFADWLQEQGEERHACLIRSMCAHHRREHRQHWGDYVRKHGEPLLTPARARAMRLWLWDDLAISTLRYRITDRTFVISARWAESAPESPRRVMVRRGMVDEVHWPMSDLLVFGDGVFAEHPVRKVRLTTPIALDMLTIRDDRLEFQFPGRARRTLMTPDGWSGDKQLLEAEWDGIEFEPCGRQTIFIEPVTPPPIDMSILSVPSIT